MPAAPQVHAASGGVGSMAVQLAKAQGAYVLGTCSAANAEYVKEVRAGHGGLCTC